MTDRALIVVTRVAVEWKGVPSEEWVASRELLLDRVCAPAFRNTTAPLTWVWRTCPQRYEQVREMAERVFPAAVVTRPSPLHDAVAPDHARFITARVDSDDAYLPTVFDWLATTSFPPNTLVNFQNGWQLDWTHGRVSNFGWANTVQQGPFLAVTHEGRSTMLGVGGNHATEARNGRKVKHVERRSWVQVVHGANIRNGWRGYTPLAPHLRDSVLERAHIEWSNP